MAQYNSTLAKNLEKQKCPHGLALHHIAVATLLAYATDGHPVNMGKPWPLDMVQVAINKGPHTLALVLKAMEQHLEDILKKVKQGQV